MTEALVHFTENDLPEMLGSLLRARTSCAKDLARRVRIDPRPAESYRAGRNLPPLPVFARMVGALGADLADAILSPGAAHARLTAEIAECEARAAEARRLRDALGGDQLGLSALPPPPSGLRSR